MSASLLLLRKGALFGGGLRGVLVDEAGSGFGVILVVLGVGATAVVGVVGLGVVGFTDRGLLGGG